MVEKSAQAQRVGTTRGDFAQSGCSRLLPSASRFTTKPAGEGTGLGLSITHDIIVKQHSGSIEVDTQPGEFTEIKVILPRKVPFTA
jgi:light-regulated signal transduction histidine kinase (bacteriophytochrome)